MSAFLVKIQHNVRSLEGKMEEQTREEDERLEEARDKVNRRRNIAGMGDVHVSASKGVILRVRALDVFL